MYHNRLQHRIAPSGPRGASHHQLRARFTRFHFRVMLVLVRMETDRPALTKVHLEWPHDVY